MSPEANNPQGPQEAKNLDTSLHPEGVRPFNPEKGDLADVAPHLEIPQDPSVIDPITRNVDFEKVDIAPVPAPTPEATSKKWYQKTATKVAGGVLALTGIIAGGVAATGGDNEPTEPRNEPVASATPNPGEGEPTGTDTQTGGETGTDTETGGETQTVEFGFDAEKYADNPEQLMVDFTDAYNTWQNTGVDAEASQDGKRYEMPLEEYANYLNETSDEAFIDAVLIPDWQSIPNLSTWVTNAVGNHRTNSMGAIVSTNPGGTEESEPYRRYVDIDPESIAVDGGGEGQIVISANWTGRDNGDKNDVDDMRDGGIDPNTESGTWRLTFFKTPDGSLRLADVQF